jgi:hypothetical protein
VVKPSQIGARRGALPPEPYAKVNPMEIFKIFPALLLDFLSKVIPGAILISALKAENLPPPELLLETLGVGNAVPTNWQGWYPLAIAILKAYIVGVFVALIANALDSLLVRKFWYERAKRNTIDFSFDGKLAPSLRMALKSSRAFGVYIEHCRTYLGVRTATPSVLLEKYRTAYRFFIALTLVCVILPLGPHRSSWTYLLFAIPCAFISIFLSERYMKKSVEYFILASDQFSAGGESAEDESKK